MMEMSKREKKQEEKIRKLSIQVKRHEEVIAQLVEVGARLVERIELDEATKEVKTSIDDKIKITDDKISHLEVSIKKDISLLQKQNEDMRQDYDYITSKIGRPKVHYRNIKFPITLFDSRKQKANVPFNSPQFYTTADGPAYKM